MSESGRLVRRIAGALVSLCFWCTILPSSPDLQAPAQGQKPEQARILVHVGLVQTDVMVFDRQGHFVPDLKPEQFELRVDGKVQPISFFELVSAGSPHDVETWASKSSKPVTAPAVPAASKANPGRTLLFFIDDWHLSADSVMRSRVALSNLINTSVGPNDKVGIFAASGQLGSAQQLTGDKAALLAPLGRFNFKSAGVEDLDYPPMNEIQASLIAQNDQDVLLYFARAIAMTNKDIVADPTRDTEKAKDVVRNRAAGLVQTAAAVAERSLSALRDLLRAAEALPGRKLVFLLSDGFVLQPHSSDIVSRIAEVTTGAARAGIMIYTLDARGLVVGLPDAKTKRAPDTRGELAHSGSNETTSSQDALNALAADTGGRFLKNTNALDTAMITTLAEVSRYYMLAWSIDLDKLQPARYSTIRASVKGRPDLSVRVRQGSLDLSQLLSKKPENR